MIIENNELVILDLSNTNLLQGDLNPDNLLDVSGISDRDGSIISPSISDFDQLTPTNFIDNNLLGNNVGNSVGFESLTGGGAINPLDNLGLLTLNDTSSANLDNLIGNEQFVSSDVSFIPSSTEIEPISLESDNQNIFSDHESNFNSLSKLDDNELSTEIQGELEGAEDEGEEKIEDLFEKLFEGKGEIEDLDPALIGELLGGDTSNLANILPFFVPPPPLPLPLPLPPTSTLDPLITLPPGISPSDFTVDQINVLNNPLSQVRRNIRFLRKDQNGCFSGEIDKHLGGPTGSGYATFTTGSQVDFLVFAPNGESVFYDGLIRQGGELFRRFGVPTFPPSRSVAEAKNITDWLNPSKYPPFLRNIELQRQRAEINRGLSVGAQCLYNLSYVAADQNLVNDINQIFPNRSQLPTYFIP